MMLTLKARPLPPNARVEILEVIPWARTEGMWVAVPGEPGVVALSADGLAELLAVPHETGEPC